MKFTTEFNFAGLLSKPWLRSLHTLRLHSTIKLSGQPQCHNSEKKYSVDSPWPSSEHLSVLSAHSATEALFYNLVSAGMQDTQDPREKPATKQNSSLTKKKQKKKTKHLTLHFKSCRSPLPESNCAGNTSELC